jgi:Putative motility protein
MDVTGIARAATTIADTGTRQEVGIAVLKRAEQIQSATAIQLLDAVSASSGVQNLPDHLGKNVNTTA